MLYHEEIVLKVPKPLLRKAEYNRKTGNAQINAWHLAGLSFELILRRIIVSDIHEFIHHFETQETVFNTRFNHVFIQELSELLAEHSLEEIFQLNYLKFLYSV